MVMKLDNIFHLVHDNPIWRKNTTEKIYVPFPLLKSDDIVECRFILNCGFWAVNYFQDTAGMHKKVKLYIFYKSN